jgi:hypothetical protein
LEAVDTYREGVFAVFGLVNEVRWNPATRALDNDVHYEFGRRMNTSSGGEPFQVTPDCVIQSNALGIISEVKVSLPLDESKWDRPIKQLKKYDRDLEGWWTDDEKITDYDVVSLVPLARAVRFGDLLEAGTRDGKWNFKHKTSVVGFFKTTGATKEFLTLKKERGEMSNNDLGERLRQSRLIDFEHLIVEYRDKKFIDQMPPLPYMLQILWDNLFVKYASSVPMDENKGWVPLKLSLDSVTTDLQEYYGFRSTGARSVEIPRKRFVRLAMDALVDFNLSEKTSTAEYLVKYKRTNIDTLKKFGRLCFQRERKMQKKAIDATPRLPGLE